VNTSLPITPETKVAHLLDAYPQLEQVLVDAAPAFSKLANPVLRRTIARVTTLARAAEVAHIPVRELVGRLREAAGFGSDNSETTTDFEDTAEDEGPVPWVDAARVRWTVDADTLLEAGQEPISEVVRRAETLDGDDLGLIRSSFRPAPLIELLESRGFRTAAVRSEDSFATFIGRLTSPDSDVQSR
jgi:hypothetical protein